VGLHRRRGGYVRKLSPVAKSSTTCAGAAKKFLKDLRVKGGRVVTTVGVAGYVAKGVVLAGAGILVIVATLQADPSKATGFDAAVKALAHAPFGQVLLVVAAAGIAAFGAYSFVRSRYGRM
jgi:hypothetical protein